MKKPTLSITIDFHTLKEIKKRAERANSSVSEFVENIIESNFYEEKSELRSEEFSKEIRELAKHNELLNAISRAYKIILDQKMAEQKKQNTNTKS